MRERPGLETAADRLVRGRAHLVRPPGAQELLAAVGEPEMRAEELVRRAEEDVDAEARRRRSARAARSAPRRPTRARPASCASSTMRAASGIVPSAFDGEREGDDPGALGQLSLEVVEVERRVLVDLDEVDPEIEVVRELEPRRDVPVVVEARDEDLVAGRERPPERAREREVERRHVLAEDRLLGPAAEEARGSRVRLLDELVAAAAGVERAAEIRVRLAQVGGDGIDHGLRALRPAGPVEERDTGGERRESRPDRLEVQRHPCSSGAIVNPCSRSCSQ